MLFHLLWIFIIWIIKPLLRGSNIIFLALFLSYMPLVSAAQDTQPFPNISFRNFSNFVTQAFHPDIPLATVLLVLFTLTDNTDLLNLHGRQQNPQYDNENSTLATGWIRALSRDLIHRLGGQLELIFLEGQCPERRLNQITQVAKKLDTLSKELSLNPFSNGIFRRKLLPVSYNEIRGTPVICTSSMYCMNAHCERRALLQTSKLQDIPLVTLVKDNTVYYQVPVLTGKCTACSTTYHGDRERFKDDRYDKWNDCYLNSAKYLKVGQSVWVDRIFGQGVINGTYNFHASASAYMQYWNDSALAKGIQFRFSRRHIWQAFVQESIRMVASVNGDELSLPENTDISTVTKLAFQKLGQKGVLPIGLNHSCSACKQPHKADADIVGNDDPAAIVDADENENVPALVGEDAEVSAANTAQARQETQRRREQLDHTMDVDDNLNRKEDVEMIILDGIVMGPTVSI